MCGILGYVGKKDSREILISGLKALEYRGYDSAGIFTCNSTDSIYKKSIGHVRELEKLVKKTNHTFGSGVAHTRWATHGKPSVQNAHPHTDCSSNIFVVHNGVIENNKEIKESLLESGHKFYSETDTEVISHLVEDFLIHGFNLEDSFKKTLAVLKGAYAILLIDKRNPDVIYASKLSSPLILGSGKLGNFLTSDKTALVGLADKILYLKDDDFVAIKRNGYEIKNNNGKSNSDFVEMDWNIERAQKGKFKHFILKEIYESVETINNTLKGRLRVKESLIKLGGLEDVSIKFKKIKRIIIVSCGTSYYAGLVGEYLFEELAKVPTEVHSSSSFRNREEPFDKNTAVLFISQSGETADTLEAIKKAKSNNLLTLGLVNVVGSSISRETDAGVYNHAGPEIAVASTKAFISQVTVLILMALYKLDTLGFKEKKLIKELGSVSTKVEKILSNADKIRKIAKKYSKYEDFFYIGKRYGYPLALEGALKLKEISYIHAEGCEAGELKHGQIALVDKNFPTFAIATNNNTLSKITSSIEEIKSRNGPVVVIATEGNEQISKIADDVLFIPKISEPVEVLLVAIVLQLFAYYVALEKGRDIDKPRNLAKSVTVE